VFYIHTKAGILRSLIGTINQKDYKGGYKGNVIFTVGTEGQEKTYFFKIKDLKNEKIRGSLATPPCATDAIKPPR
jgi:hypothetical protein